MSGEKNHPAKKPKLEIVTKREATDHTDKTEGECKFDIKKHEERVRAQEIDQLREFTVLDEVKSDDEDDSNDDDSETSTIGLPDEELDKMLDENLPDDFKSAPKQKDETFVTRTKLVLEEKGVDQFENLPLDWMMLRHYSGMPIYMHRITRVCTLSKPYYIGKGNTRKHDIPISAIPCLLYRRALEEEQKQEIIDNRIQEQIQIKLDERKRAGEGTSGVKTEKKETTNVGSKDDLKKKNDIEKCPFLLPKKEPSVEEPKDDKHLTPQQVNEYWKRLLKLKKDNIVHFKGWADRGKYCEALKTLQYPTLPAPHFYKMESEHRAKVEVVERRAESAERNAKELKQQVAPLARDHAATEKLLQALTGKVAALSSDLKDERELASALSSSHKQWQARATSTEEGLSREVKELKEQLRDVMFFVEGRSSLAATAPAEELEEAKVTVAPAKPRRKRR